jgi:small conductance mechanosensitive channel
MSRDWSRAVLDVPLAAAEDVSRALQVLEQVGRDLVADEQIGPALTEDLKVTGIEGLDGWTVRLRIMVRTLPGQHW